MSTAITIPKELPQNSALSFDFLREEAIKTIQELSPTTWTDHNTHDPGITILEQVCYAITDLAYRLDYDMQDLLGNKLAAYQELYSPATILSTSPVTLLDYRKLILDTKGVRNAWIEKVTTSKETIKGLYTVSIEKDDAEDSGSNLIRTIKNKLQANRGLCEDFQEIKLLDKQKIRFSGAIEISEATDDSDQLIAEILYCLHWNLSPAITFYSLQELQNKGKRIDTIFDGPTLEYGFIDDDELIENTRKHEIHASDMIKEIMDIENIITVQNFSIASGTNEVKNWVFPLDTSKTPILDVSATLNSLSFKVSGLETSTNQQRILELYEAKINAYTSKKTLPLSEKDILIKVGEDQEIENYYSIQDQFPANFGIGNMGLPETASPKRKAQAKQLTAYLTFFDQLLANYFSQTANFFQLVSVEESSVATNFKQSLLEKVTGLEAILQNKETYEAYIGEETSTSLENLQRKNKFLNHLLARYSESFTAYGMLMQEVDEDQILKEQKLIQDKISFLKAYPAISAQRGKGFDYTFSEEEELATSGLEQRILKKLGVSVVEDIFMVEHIILRPKSSDTTTLDNYYQAHSIESVEVLKEEDRTKITTSNIDVNIGSRIAIFKEEKPLGIFTVQAIAATHFEIKTQLDTNETNTLSWKRVDADLRFQVFTNPINLFKVGSSSQVTFCNVNHYLQNGDEIYIVGSMHYNGNYTVQNCTNEGFEIAIPFQENETTARFGNSFTTTDNYSLQVTFILPKESDQFQKSRFKNFVETTIREETPVHITSHIKWLSAPEIVDFKKTYQKFMSKIK